MTNKNRTRQVKLLFTDDEYEKIKKLAGRKPVAKLLRETAMQEISREAAVSLDELVGIRPNVAQLTRQLAGIGNNLNQLTRVVNRQIAAGEQPVINKSELKKIQSNLAALEQAYVSEIFPQRDRKDKKR